eukprot:4319678-Pleurochrysis_carterae.AAC.1
MDSQDPPRPQIEKVWPAPPRGLSANEFKIMDMLRCVLATTRLPLLTAFWPEETFYECDAYVNGMLKMARFAAPKKSAVPLITL